ncbi:hypothetical protein MO867_15500 [Microbulbifer sp. OS29]|uniref:Uncharacterized protein n=1 Tax=Microbulbifer okhotskensis TaxID=2926617 RepID=A0A9X2EQ19_9GAMM|nr:hypothetical protein [Microbulbifer okhotskensis]MCO1335741.1 hypothetical protein [Microbulbifer okhotskensis]
MELENDLREFLSKGNQLEYDISCAEPGQIGLYHLDELKPGVVWIYPESDDGYYEIPAVDLTSKNDHYAPEYLLLWLPNEKMYGAWDCDHLVLTVFPETTWKEIVKNPLPYINAQWEDGGEVYEPTHYPLKPGCPYDKEC